MNIDPGTSNSLCEYIANFTELLELSTDRIPLHLSPGSNTMKRSINVRSSEALPAGH